jgi:acyl-CoA dehydrogenase
LTAHTPSVQALLERARRFIDEEVIPRENLRRAHERNYNLALVQELRALAVSQGLTAPRGAVADGGLGLSWVQCCAYLETAGRSFLGPGALQCAAPGQPDITTLEALATPLQRERYLRPLVEGTLRSCFAMSEPTPGVGSDPRMLSSRAERTARGWRLNGHKWFATSASVADFAIVMARTEIGPSLFLVDVQQPGFDIVRDVPTVEPFDLGGHAELRLQDCEIPADALLGEEGKGLEHAQLRLEGARLFHCMRLIGLSSRAMSMAQQYAQARQSHSSRLSEHQMVQAMVADAHIELHAARLMTVDTAQRLDAGQSIRHHSAMTKVFVSEAVNRIADSAVQITGALGISEDWPLSMIQRLLRPFRIYDGASEVHRSAIARRVFHQGLDA